MLCARYVSCKLLENLNEGLCVCLRLSDVRTFNDSDTWSPSLSDRATSTDTQTWQKAQHFTHFRHFTPLHHYLVATEKEQFYQVYTENIC